MLSVKSTFDHVANKVRVKISDHLRPASPTCALKEAEIHSSEIIKFNDEGG